MLNYQYRIITQQIYTKIMLKKLSYKFTIFLKFLFLSFLVLSNTSAHAYFDPVTTTTILQGLFAIIAAIILYMKNPKQIIVDLKNLFTRNKDSETKDKKDLDNKK